MIFHLKPTILYYCDIRYKRWQSGGDAQKGKKESGGLWSVKLEMDINSDVSIFHGGCYIDAVISVMDARAFLPVISQPNSHKPP